MISTLPRPKRTKPNKYGETKNRYQFMLTVTASEKVDEIAEKLNITRSEVLERLVRIESLNDKLLSEAAGND